MHALISVVSPCKPDTRSRHFNRRLLAAMHVLITEGTGLGTKEQGWVAHCIIQTLR